MFSKRSLRLSLALIALLLMNSACAQNCQIENDALRSMPDTVVSVSKFAGSESAFKLDVRLADNSRTRAAGFQNVCKEGIANKPILFVFGMSVKPSFHMRNVVAPIDIAFIRKDGSIDSIHQMKPYILGSRRGPLYSSKGSVIAALEVSPGFFEQNGISIKSQISWTK